MRSFAGLRDIWFSTRPYDYFPLTLTSFWLEWRLWGLNAVGYHATNVLLHATGALLLWRVLSRLQIPGSWLAALVFAVHPVCVASVAWITERKNTLSLVFFLLSVLWYLRFDAESRLPASAHKARWYALALLAFLLALLSKTSVVTLPFILLLCIWWQQTPAAHRLESSRLDPDGNAASPGREGVGRRLFNAQLFLRLSPFFGLALVLGLVTIWFQTHRAMPGQLITPEGRGVRLLGGSWAVWFYLGKVLWPADLTMIYPRWKIQPASVAAYIPALLWIGGMALTWRFRRGWGRGALFGLGYFFLILLPVLGFFDMSYFSFSRVSDHLQYLAALGVITLAVGGLSARLNPPALNWSAAVLVTLLGILTWRHARIYAKEEMLWRDNLAKNPDAWAAYNNLGMMLTNLDEAQKCYVRSLELQPNHSGAHNNLGTVLCRKGQFAEGIKHFHEALRLRPSNLQAHINLAGALLDLKHPDEARTVLSKALELDPECADAYELWGEALLQENQPTEAVKYFDRALQLDPARPNPHLALGNLALREERHADAAACYRKVLRVRPDSVEARQNLGLALTQSGRTEEAIAEFTALLKLKPDFVAAEFTLASLLQKVGRTAEARQHFASVLQKQPDYAEAHYRLGILLGREQQTDEAIQQLRQVLRLQPEDAAAHEQLALMLVRQQKFPEAIGHFQLALKHGGEPAATHNHLGLAHQAAGQIEPAVENYWQALQVRPDWSEALNNLAWVLATQRERRFRDGKQAVELATRAVELTRTNDAAKLDTLAAAYAEAGRFADAVQTARQALGLADSVKQQSLAEGVRNRLKEYQSGQPHRE